MQEIEETQVESLGWGDPLEKGMATPPVFLPEESHGQRSLMGCSPWSQQESDTMSATWRARMHMGPRACSLKWSQFLALERGLSSCGRSLVAPHHVGSSQNRAINSCPLH